MLEIINAEEDILDDRGVIEALKEAKADVFETLNIVTSEKKLLMKMELEMPTYKQVSTFIYYFLKYENMSAWKNFKLIRISGVKVFLD